MTICPECHGIKSVIVCRRCYEDMLQTITDLHRSSHKLYQDKLIGFACGNAPWTNSGEKSIYKNPPAECYERQITHLQDLLREAVGLLVRAKSMMPKSHQYSELWYDIDEDITGFKNRPEVQKAIGGV